MGAKAAGVPLFYKLAQQNCRFARSHRSVTCSANQNNQTSSRSISLLVFQSARRQVAERVKKMHGGSLAEKLLLYSRQ